MTTRNVANAPGCQATDPATHNQVADALEACDWTDTPIGNKAIVAQAIACLRSGPGQPTSAVEHPKGDTADWPTAAHISQTPGVHQALKLFSEDPSGDAGVSLVREVLETMRASFIVDEGLRTENRALRAELAEIKIAARAVLAARDIDDVPYGHPGHVHSVRGRWDSTGKICDDCAAYESLASCVKPAAAKCDHEWTDDGEFLQVCTACSTQEDHNPAWLDMEIAPRDGTMIRLLVEFTEHPTQDEEQAPTIGSNNFDNDGEDVWQFAGWCWSHDHFVDGKGTPVGWLPMVNPPKVIAGGTDDEELLDEAS